MRRDDSGQILPLLAVSLWACLLMAGVMICDVGHGYQVAQRMQAAADASALGAAQVGSCLESARLAAENAPEAHLTCSLDADGRATVEASEDVDSFMLPALTFHVRRSAAAEGAGGSPGQPSFDWTLRNGAVVDGDGLFCNDQAALDGPFPEQLLSLPGFSDLTYTPSYTVGPWSYRCLPAPPAGDDGSYLGDLNIAIIAAAAPCTGPWTTCSTAPVTCSGQPYAGAGGNGCIKATVKGAGAVMHLRYLVLRWYDVTLGCNPVVNPSTCPTPVYISAFGSHPSTAAVGGSAAALVQ